MEDMYFLISRGTQPNVSFAGNDVVYSPQLSDSISGTAGVWQDKAAALYWRPYHRIVVPVNATAIRGGTGDWYVTVANLQQGALAAATVAMYSIRIVCVTEAAAPCPQPDPYAQDCSGHGMCAMNPNAQVDNKPGLNKVCQCDPNYGDYGCNLNVTTLDNDASADFVMNAGEWRYFQLKVALDQSDARLDSLRKPTLLVELTRQADGGFGGDPVLLLMPRDASGRVPWYGDVNRRADLRSYFLQQSFHYLLLRNLTEGLSPFEPTSLPVRSALYYVAVYNNNQRFMRDPQLANTRASLSLRVRWRTEAMGPNDRGLCPRDCSGRGTCWDPSDPLNVALDMPMPILPAMPNAKPLDFQCACSAGFGGTFCEGGLRNLTVSTTGDGATQTSLPGQWYYYILDINPKQFNYRSNDLAIEWLVRSGASAPEPSANSYNAILTINQQSFPRAADLDSDDPFKRGWQIFYPTLSAKNDPPLPLQVKGNELKPGYSYVLGVYNSEYLKQQDFRFALTVYVPTTSSTWLHPYMSVVLGVTASVILCLFMTLCRRFVQRHGWGPFRPVPPVRGTVVQIAPRPAQGVPGHIIQTFHCYEYHATKAEKAQLIKSRRDADHQAQKQRVSESGAATPAEGNDSKPPAITVVPEDGVPVPAAQPPPVVAALPAGVGSADDDEPQCTVCLCEYEEGENITQLPCKHEFHSTCINKWMQTHNTCPICRISLVPLPDPDEDGSSAGASGGDDAPAIGRPAVGSVRDGVVVIPMGSATAGGAEALSAQQQRPASARRFSGFLGQFRRTQPDAGQQQQLVSLQQQQQPPPPSPPAAGGSGTALPQAYAAPSGGSAIVTGLPSNMQLVARGPSATLDGARSPASPSRLAASRTASPAMEPVPLAPTGRPGTATPQVDHGPLPQQVVADGAEQGAQHSEPSHRIHMW